MSMMSSSTFALVSGRAMPFCSGNQPGLFEPARIGSMTVKHRFIRSATHEGMATVDGMPLPSVGGLPAFLCRDNDCEAKLVKGLD